MTTDKDFKRLVRARMQKTGESYTAARSHFAARQSPAKPAKSATVAIDYARLAGRSDEIVKARTGCTWERWVKALDQVRAYEWTHRDIARYVSEKYRIEGWWAQSVTVGYERIKGLRAIGQRRSGAWEASKSRTFAAPLEAIFRAFHDSRRRSRWMTGADPTVRGATPGKSMRLTWPDGSSVIILFAAKGATKSQVAIQHEKLPDQAAAVQMKAYWAERLEALGHMVE